MKVCPYCHNTCSDEEQHCVKCGQSLPQRETFFSVGDNRVEEGIILDKSTTNILVDSKPIYDNCKTCGNPLTLNESYRCPKCAQSPLCRSCFDVQKRMCESCVKEQEPGPPSEEDNSLKKDSIFSETGEMLDPNDPAPSREKALEHARKELSRKVNWLRDLELIWEVESARYDEDEKCYKVLLLCYPKDIEVETKARWEYHIDDETGQLMPGTPMLRTEGIWMKKRTGNNKKVWVSVATVTAIVLIAVIVIQSFGDDSGDNDEGPVSIIQENDNESDNMPLSTDDATPIPTVQPSPELIEPAVQFGLTASVNPPNGGSITPSGGTYNGGEKISLTAVPASGWRFDHWDGTDSNAVNPTTVTMNKAKEVTAYMVEKTPEASFIASLTSGDSPLEVRFTDQSTGNVTSWSWDFGDGNSSTAENPSHTYSDAGAYTVRLTVEGPIGSDNMTMHNYINVYTWTQWYDLSGRIVQGHPVTRPANGYQVRAGEAVQINLTGASPDIEMRIQDQGGSTIKSFGRTSQANYEYTVEADGTHYINITKCFSLIDCDFTLKYRILSIG